MLLDKRVQPRVGVSKTAKIVLESGNTIECTVQNCSNNGVCIEVDSPTRIPESFLLVKSSDGTSHSCHVKWRFGKRIGLDFE
jgi:PilZ domain